MQGDDARVPLARGRMPGDALVGPLLADLGIPFPSPTARGSDPVEVRVVELPNLLDPLHEARKLLELRPLVVGGLDRDVHLNRLLNPDWTTGAGIGNGCACRG